MFWTTHIVLKKTSAFTPNWKVFSWLFFPVCCICCENKDLVCACASPVPWLTNPPLQARALRFFMPDKSSTTMSGTQYEWSAAVKTSNSLWMTTWLKVLLLWTVYLLFYNTHDMHGHIQYVTTVLISLFSIIYLRHWCHCGIHKGDTNTDIFLRL